MVFRKAGYSGQFIHADVLLQMITDVKQNWLNIVFQYINNRIILSGSRKRLKKAFSEFRWFPNACLLLESRLFIHPWRTGRHWDDGAEAVKSGLICYPVKQAWSRSLAPFCW